MIQHVTIFIVSLELLIFIHYRWLSWVKSTKEERRELSFVPVFYSPAFALPPNSWPVSQHIANEWSHFSDSQWGITNEASILTQVWAVLSEVNKKLYLDHVCKIIQRKKKRKNKINIVCPWGPFFLSFNRMCRWYDMHHYKCNMSVLKKSFLSMHLFDFYIVSDGKQWKCIFCSYEKE